MTKRLSINVSDDLADNLEQFVEEYGWSKRDVVSQALRLFMAIKDQEKEFRNAHPNGRVSMSVKFQSSDLVQASDLPQGKIASMMIY